MRNIIHVLFSVVLFCSLFFDAKLAQADDTYVSSFLASGVNPAALSEALAYLKKNSHLFPNQQYLALIDYGLPSSEERLFIFNLQNGSYEKLLVAHGRNSGLNYSTSFSNQLASFKSSLGAFRTDDVYTGKHGTSLRLKGLSPTNSAALDRAIVIHGADYVNKELIRTQGRIGRSQGCPALEPNLSNRVIDQLKGGSLIHAFTSRELGPTDDF